MAAVDLPVYIRRGPTMVNYVTTMTLLFYLVVADLMLFQTVNGQAYHFSKGWMPGRKRTSGVPLTASAAAGHVDSSAANSGLHHIDSAATLVDAVRRAVYGAGAGDATLRVGNVDEVHGELNSPSSAAVCLMRSHVYRLVIDIIRDGFKKFDESCEGKFDLPGDLGSSWEDINYFRRQSPPVQAAVKKTQKTFKARVPMRCVVS